MSDEQKSKEPFRRGYAPGQWDPGAADFLTDLHGARAGGAAGWCFHNGSTQGSPGENPRKSFDLRQRDLFGQLDGKEQEFLRSLFNAL